MSGARHVPRPAVRLTAEQEPFLAIRSLATNYASGYRIEPHHHPWHHFLYAISGAMTVLTSDSSWMIPTGRAVFIPAASTHAIRMWGAVEMRTVYLAPAMTEFHNTTCRVVEVCPLLRELVLRAVDRVGLDSRAPRDARLIALLEDEIGDAMAAPAYSLMLPMPHDERALAAARCVLENPAMTGTVNDLAKLHALARRTLERRFREETGLSFGMWRQKARLLDSIRLLAEGTSVTATALDSGYSSVSAFVSAFRATFGYTPGRIQTETKILADVANFAIDL
jgi:AraC-like DNA-binding protein